MDCEPIRHEFADLRRAIPVRPQPKHVKRVTAPGRNGNEHADVGDRMKRYMAFAAKLPDAISGQGGHNTTLQWACEAIRFGLSDGEAMLALEHLNSTKTGGAPWTDAELRHKLADARRKVEADGEVGIRLKEARRTRRRVNGNSIGDQNGSGKRQEPDHAGDNEDVEGADVVCEDVPPWQPTHLSQQINAERLVVELAGKVRFDPSRGQYLAYDDTRFVVDNMGVVDLAAKRVARATWGFLSEPPAGIDHRSAFKHALDSEKASGIAAMMKLVQTEPGIPAPSARFDVDPFLLNVLNGTIDLRTGKLRPHRREDLLTKLAPVNFDPAAQAPLWFSFLDRIMAGNAGLIAYLRRIAGLCLTGDASVQELFVFFGSGANGKSVFLDTLAGLMGDYGSEAPPSLVTSRTNDEHPTEIADLCGKRLVVASETEEGAKLRIQLVKRLTGNARIKGRFMRQDYFEFPRTHKLVLVTNNKPLIRETTNAVWRRVRLIPFTVTIPRKEQDPQLLAKLRGEWPGILAWAVQGCLDWQANGMQAPPEVVIATEEYQAEQDPLRDYLAERCILAADAYATRSESYPDYQDWANKVGERHPMDRTTFYDHLRRVPNVSEGFKRIGGNMTRVWQGIGLVDLGKQYQKAHERAAG